MAERLQARLAPEEIDKLIRGLARRGYQVLGPTVRDGAIVYDEVAGAQDLPRGWTDEQEAGRYRLKPGTDGALFGCSVGPESWKKYLHPAQVKLFEADRQDGLFRILGGPAPPARPYAFLGVRACELAAIAVQDRVLLQDKYRDPVYGSRRDPAFLVAVQCTQAAATCFCASMGTGPQVRGAADLTLTEIVNAEGHWFLAEADGDRGQEVLAELDRRPATDEELRLARTAVESAAAQQVRRMDTAGIRDLLYQNFEHPRWDEVAARCLTCANCTMVCPTCFCTTVEDDSGVTGDRAERWRRWDSCFTMAFSYIHGGSVRTSSKARYRQWLTHKLASWIDQFGSSGCVGCGRCIAWCPAGIDLTEEVHAIRGAVNHGNTDA
ncbi:MAG: 4Fe-4S dicluster domain-containing protein [Acidobacteriia bacterium]|nr:4Fe-4S dicluster domain-containing protein [Terriglobia bacterium]